jgi:hypothetical protein
MNPGTPDGAKKKATTSGDNNKWDCIPFDVQQECRQLITYFNNPWVADKECGKHRDYRHIFHGDRGEIP